MEEETCSFVVDTNGCGMTPWGDDGAWHNDNIEVNYLENRYTIHYDGNGEPAELLLLNRMCCMENRFNYSRISIRKSIQ